MLLHLKDIFQTPLYLYHRPSALLLTDQCCYKLVSICHETTIKNNHIRNKNRLIQTLSVNIRIVFIVVEWFELWERILDSFFSQKDTGHLSLSWTSIKNSRKFLIHLIENHRIFLVFLKVREEKVMPSFKCSLKN